MFQPGEFIQERLVTDTLVHEVVATTAQTITIRPTKRGETVRTEHHSGNPYPVTFHEAIVDTEAPTKKLRLRQDNTFRTSDSGQPLLPARLIDGIPVTRTDYRE